MDFDAILKNVDAFLSCSPVNCTEEIKECLKIKYDNFISKRKHIEPNTGLQKLVVKNFDLEQIWQQLELNYASSLSKALTRTSEVCKNSKKHLLPLLDLSDEEEDIEKDENISNNKSNDSSGNSDNESEGEKEADKSSELEENNGTNGNDSENEMLENEDNLEEEDLSDTRKENGKNAVEDKFFKLEEMENFLKSEENQKPKKKQHNEEDDDEDSDEESIDYFEDLDDNDEGIEEDDEEEDDRQLNPKYDDFFGDSEEKPLPSKKRKKHHDSESELSDLENITESDIKSTFELREERVKKKIKAIEEEALDEKPWQLKGEVTSENRPENSLLEKVLEFDLTSKPAPVITEECNLKLEDIIRKRIKDKLFDSVERKEKPVETPLEFKKKLTLDSEKSKESLAQIYEREYLQQKAALQPNAEEKPEEEPQQVKEIRTMMTSLFQKLDALSNFHYTPRVVAPELKIVSNLPAITLEEVAPVTSTDASALAPEEIRQKKVKGDIIGESERTTTDKKRQRRRKKAKQKQHAILQKKKEEQKKNVPMKYINKYNKIGKPIKT